MGWFSGLYRKIIVGSWNSPQAAMTARGPGTRKAPGDGCLCGKGFLCRACSPIHGWFLGCTQFRITGCRRAWTIDGRRQAQPRPVPFLRSPFLWRSQRMPGCQGGIPEVQT